ncbi:hypothetical protein [Streptomyces sp. NPDC058583]|uniref:hypothetical protein n=1 Tax=Streptomyces sp. NPDC058583 TaxID=3346549 RepID=UPI00365077CB
MSDGFWAAVRAAIPVIIRQVIAEIVKGAFMMVALNVAAQVVGFAKGTRKEFGVENLKEVGLNAAFGAIGGAIGFGVAKVFTGVVSKTLGQKAAQSFVAAVVGGGVNNVVTTVAMGPIVTAMTGASGHLTWHVLTSGLAFGAAGGAHAAAQRTTVLSVNPAGVPRMFNNRFVQVKTNFNAGPGSAGPGGAGAGVGGSGGSRGINEKVELSLSEKPPSDGASDQFSDVESIRSDSTRSDSSDAGSRHSGDSSGSPSRPETVVDSGIVAEVADRAAGETPPSTSRTADEHTSVAAVSSRSETPVSGLDLVANTTERATADMVSAAADRSDTVFPDAAAMDATAGAGAQPSVAGRGVGETLEGRSLGIAEVLEPTHAGPLQPSTPPAERVTEPLPYEIRGVDTEGPTSFDVSSVRTEGAREGTTGDPASDTTRPSLDERRPVSIDDVLSGQTSDQEIPGTVLPGLDPLPGSANSAPPSGPLGAGNSQTAGSHGVVPLRAPDGARAPDGLGAVGRPGVSAAPPTPSIGRPSAIDTVVAGSGSGASTQGVRATSSTAGVEAQQSASPTGTQRPRDLTVSATADASVADPAVARRPGPQGASGSRMGTEPTAADLAPSELELDLAALRRGEGEVPRDVESEAPSLVEMEQRALELGITREEFADYQERFRTAVRKGDLEAAGEIAAQRDEHVRQRAVAREELAYRQGESPADSVDLVAAERQRATDAGLSEEAWQGFEDLIREAAADGRPADAEALIRERRHLVDGLERTSTEAEAALEARLQRLREGDTAEDAAARDALIEELRDQPEPYRLSGEADVQQLLDEAPRPGRGGEVSVGDAQVLESLTARSRTAGLPPEELAAWQQRFGESLAGGPEESVALGRQWHEQLESLTGGPRRDPQELLDSTTATAETQPEALARAAEEAGVTFKEHAGRMKEIRDAWAEGRVEDARDLVDRFWARIEQARADEHAVWELELGLWQAELKGMSPQEYLALRVRQGAVELALKESLASLLDRPDDRAPDGAGLRERVRRIADELPEEATGSGAAQALKEVLDATPVNTPEHRLRADLHALLDESGDAGWSTLKPLLDDVPTDVLADRLDQLPKTPEGDAVWTAALMDSLSFHADKQGMPEAEIAYWRETVQDARSQGADTSTLLEVQRDWNARIQQHETLRTLSREAEQARQNAADRASYGERLTSALRQENVPEFRRVERDWKAEIAGAKGEAEFRRAVEDASASLRERADRFAMDGEEFAAFEQRIEQARRVGDVPELLRAVEERVTRLAELEAAYDATIAERLTALRDGPHDGVAGELEAWDEALAPEWRTKNVDGAEQVSREGGLWNLFEDRKPAHLRDERSDPGDDPLRDLDEGRGPDDDDSGPGAEDRDLRRRLKDLQGDLLSAAEKLRMPQEEIEAWQNRLETADDPVAVREELRRRIRVELPAERALDARIAEFESGRRQRLLDLGFTPEELNAHELGMDVAVRRGDTEAAMRLQEAFDARVEARWNEAPVDLEPAVGSGSEQQRGAGTIGRGDPPDFRTSRPGPDPSTRPLSEGPGETVAQGSRAAETDADTGTSRTGPVEAFTPEPPTPEQLFAELRRLSSGEIGEAPPPERTAESLKALLDLSDVVPVAAVWEFESAAYPHLAPGQKLLARQIVADAMQFDLTIGRNGESLEQRSPLEFWTQVAVAQVLAQAAGGVGQFDVASARELAERIRSDLGLPRPRGIRAGTAPGEETPFEKPGESSRQGAAGATAASVSGEDGIGRRREDDHDQGDQEQSRGNGDGLSQVPPDNRFGSETPLTEGDAGELPPLDVLRYRAAVPPGEDARLADRLEYAAVLTLFGHQVGSALTSTEHAPTVDKYKGQGQASNSHGVGILQATGADVWVRASKGLKLEDLRKSIEAAVQARENGETFYPTRWVRDLFGRVTHHKLRRVEGWMDALGLHEHAIPPRSTRAAMVRVAGEAAARLIAENGGQEPLDLAQRVFRHVMAKAPDAGVNGYQLVVAEEWIRQARVNQERAAHRRRVWESAEYRRAFDQALDVLERTPRVPRPSARILRETLVDHFGVGESVARVWVAEFLTHARLNAFHGEGSSVEARLLRSTKAIAGSVFGALPWDEASKSLRLLRQLHFLEIADVLVFTGDQREAEAAADWHRRELGIAHVPRTVSGTGHRRRRSEETDNSEARRAQGDDRKAKRQRQDAPSTGEEDPSTGSRTAAAAVSEELLLPELEESSVLPRLDALRRTDPAELSDPPRSHERPQYAAKLALYLNWSGQVVHATAAESYVGPLTGVTGRNGKAKTQSMLQGVGASVTEHASTIANPLFLRKAINVALSSRGRGEELHGVRMTRQVFGFETIRGGQRMDGWLEVLGLLGHPVPQDSTIGLLIRGAGEMADRLKADNGGQDAPGYAVEVFRKLMRLKPDTSVDDYQEIVAGEWIRQARENKVRAEHRRQVWHSTAHRERFDQVLTFLDKQPLKTLADQADRIRGRLAEHHGVDEALAAVWLDEYHRHRLLYEKYREDSEYGASLLSRGEEIIVSSFGELPEQPVAESHRMLRRLLVLEIAHVLAHTDDRRVGERAADEKRRDLGLAPLEPVQDDESDSSGDGEGFVEAAVPDSSGTNEPGEAENSAPRPLVSPDDVPGRLAALRRLPQERLRHDTEEPERYENAARTVLSGGAHGNLSLASAWALQGVGAPTGHASTRPYTPSRMRRAVERAVEARENGRIYRLKNESERDSGAVGRMDTTAMEGWLGALGLLEQPIAGDSTRGLLVREAGVIAERLRAGSGGEDPPDLAARVFRELMGTSPDTQVDDYQEIVATEWIRQARENRARAEHRQWLWHLTAYQDLFGRGTDFLRQLPQEETRSAAPLHELLVERFQIDAATARVWVAEFYAYRRLHAAYDAQDPHNALVLSEAGVIAGQALGPLPLEASRSLRELRQLQLLEIAELLHLTGDGEQARGAAAWMRRDLGLAPVPRAVGGTGEMSWTDDTVKPGESSRSRGSQGRRRAEDDSSDDSADDNHRVKRQRARSIDPDESGDTNDQQVAGGEAGWMRHDLGLGRGTEEDGAERSDPKERNLTKALERERGTLPLDWAAEAMREVEDEVADTEDEVADTDDEEQSDDFEEVPLGVSTGATREGTTRHARPGDAMALLDARRGQAPEEPREGAHAHERLEYATRLALYSHAYGLTVGDSTSPKRVALTTGLNRNGKSQAQTQATLQGVGAPVIIGQQQAPQTPTGLKQSIAAAVQARLKGETFYPVREVESVLHGDSVTPRWRMEGWLGALGLLDHSIPADSSRGLLVRAAGNIARRLTDDNGGRELSDLDERVFRELMAVKPDQDVDEYQRLVAAEWIRQAQVNEAKAGHRRRVWHSPEYQGLFGRGLEFLESLPRTSSPAAETMRRQLIARFGIEYATARVWVDEYMTYRRLSDPEQHAHSAGTLRLAEAIVGPALGPMPREDEPAALRMLRRLQLLEIAELLHRSGDDQLAKGEVAWMRYDLGLAPVPETDADADDSDEFEEVPLGGGEESAPSAVTGERRSRTAEPPPRDAMALADADDSDEFEEVPLGGGEESTPSAVTGERRSRTAEPPPRDAMALLDALREQGPPPPPEQQARDRERLEYASRLSLFLNAGDQWISASYGSDYIKWVSGYETGADGLSRGQGLMQGLGTPITINGRHALLPPEMKKAIDAAVKVNETGDTFHPGREVGTILGDKLDYRRKKLDGWTRALGLLEDPIPAGSARGLLIRAAGEIAERMTAENGGEQPHDLAVRVFREVMGKGADTTVDGFQELVAAEWIRQAGANRAKAGHRRRVWESREYQELFGKGLEFLEKLPRMSHYEPENVRAELVGQFGVEGPVARVWLAEFFAHRRLDQAFDQRDRNDQRFLREAEGLVGSILGTLPLDTATRALRMVRQLQTFEIAGVLRYTGDLDKAREETEWMRQDLGLGHGNLQAIEAEPMDEDEDGEHVEEPEEDREIPVRASAAPLDARAILDRRRGRLPEEPREGASKSERLEYAARLGMYFNAQGETITLKESGEYIAATTGATPGALSGQRAQGMLQGVGAPVAHKLWKNGVTVKGLALSIEEAVRAGQDGEPYFPAREAARVFGRTNKDLRKKMEEWLDALGLLDHPIATASTPGLLVRASGEIARRLTADNGGREPLDLPGRVFRELMEMGPEQELDDYQRLVAAEWIRQASVNRERARHRQRLWNSPEYQELVGQGLALLEALPRTPSATAESMRRQLVEQFRIEYATARVWVDEFLRFRRLSTLYAKQDPHTRQVLSGAETITGSDLGPTPAVTGEGALGMLRRLHVLEIADVLYATGDEQLAKGAAEWMRQDLGLERRVADLYRDSADDMSVELSEPEVPSDVEESPESRERGESDSDDFEEVPLGRAEDVLARSRSMARNTGGVVPQPPNAMSLLEALRDQIPQPPGEGAGDSERLEYASHLSLYENARSQWVHLSYKSDHVLWLTGEANGSIGLPLGRSLLQGVGGPVVVQWKKKPATPDQLSASIAAAVKAKETGSVFQPVIEAREVLSAKTPALAGRMEGWLSALGLLEDPIPAGSVRGLLIRAAGEVADRLTAENGGEQPEGLAVRVFREVMGKGPDTTVDGFQELVAEEWIRQAAEWQARARHRQRVWYSPEYQNLFGKGLEFLERQPPTSWRSVEDVRGELVRRFRIGEAVARVWLADFLTYRRLDQAFDERDAANRGVLKQVGWIVGSVFGLMPLETATGALRMLRKLQTLEIAGVLRYTNDVNMAEAEAERMRQDLAIESRPRGVGGLGDRTPPYDPDIEGESSKNPRSAMAPLASRTRARDDVDLSEAGFLTAKRVRSSWRSSGSSESGDSLLDDSGWGDALREVEEAMNESEEESSTVDRSRWSGAESEVSVLEEGVPGDPMWADALREVEEAMDDSEEYEHEDDGASTDVSDDAWASELDRLMNETETDSASGGDALTRLDALRGVPPEDLRRNARDEERFDYAARLVLNSNGQPMKIKKLGARAKQLAGVEVLHSNHKAMIPAYLLAVGGHVQFNSSSFVTPNQFRLAVEGAVDAKENGRSFHAVREVGTLLRNGTAFGQKRLGSWLGALGLLDRPIAGYSIRGLLVRSAGEAADELVRGNGGRELPDLNARVLRRLMALTPDADVDEYQQIVVGEWIRQDRANRAKVGHRQRLWHDTAYRALFRRGLDHLGMLPALSLYEAEAVRSGLGERFGVDEPTSRLWFTEFMTHRRLSAAYPTEGSQHVTLLADAESIVDAVLGELPEATASDALWWLRRLQVLEIADVLHYWGDRHMARTEARWMRQELRLGPIRDEDADVTEGDDTPGVEGDVDAETDADSEAPSIEDQEDFAAGFEEEPVERPWGDADLESFPLPGEAQARLDEIRNHPLVKPGENATWRERIDYATRVAMTHNKAGQPVSAIDNMLHVTGVPNAHGASLGYLQGVGAAVLRQQGNWASVDRMVVSTSSALGNAVRAAVKAKEDGEAFHPVREVLGLLKSKSEFARKVLDGWLEVLGLLDHPVPPDSMRAKLIRAAGEIADELTAEQDGGHNDPEITERVFRRLMGMVPEDVVNGHQAVVTEEWIRQARANRAQSLHRRQLWHWDHADYRERFAEGLEFLGQHVAKIVPPADALRRHLAGHYGLDPVSAQVWVDDFHAYRRLGKHFGDDDPHRARLLRLATAIVDGYLARTPLDSVRQLPKTLHRLHVLKIADMLERSSVPEVLAEQIWGTRSDALVALVASALQAHPRERRQRDVTVKRPPVPEPTPDPARPRDGKAPIPASPPRREPGPESLKSFESLLSGSGDGEASPVSRATKYALTAARNGNPVTPAGLAAHLNTDDRPLTAEDELRAQGLLESLGLPFTEFTGEQVEGFLKGLRRVWRSNETLSVVGLVKEFLTPDPGPGLLARADGWLLGASAHMVEGLPKAFVSVAQVLATLPGTAPTGLPGDAPSVVAQRLMAQSHPSASLKAVLDHWLAVRQPLHGTEPELSGDDEVATLRSLMAGSGEGESSPVARAIRYVLTAATHGNLVTPAELAAHLSGTGRPLNPEDELRAQGLMEALGLPFTLYSGERMDQFFGGLREAWRHQQIPDVVSLVTTHVTPDPSPGLLARADGWVLGSSPHAEEGLPKALVTAAQHLSALPGTSPLGYPGDAPSVVGGKLLSSERPTVFQQATVKHWLDLDPAAPQPRPTTPQPTFEQALQTFRELSKVSSAPPLPPVSGLEPRRDTGTGTTAGTTSSSTAPKTRDLSSLKGQADLAVGFLYGRTPMAGNPTPANIGVFLPWPIGAVNQASQVHWLLVQHDAVYRAHFAQGLRLLADPSHTTEGLRRLVASFGLHSDVADLWSEESTRYTVVKNDATRVEATWWAEIDRLLARDAPELAVPESGDEALGMLRELRRWRIAARLLAKRSWSAAQDEIKGMRVEYGLAPSPRT